MAERLGFKVVDMTYQSKLVPLSLIIYQSFRIIGIKPRTAPAFSRTPILVNPFDAGLVTLRWPG
jgi:hypothetical protein